jgi:hypothetical protein
MPTLPMLPEELISAPYIPAELAVGRSELSYLFGWAEGAALPLRILDRIVNAIDAYDRLLVEVVERRRSEGTL